MPCSKPSRPYGLGRRWWTDGRCRVNAAIAVLGTIVAAQYLVIGLYVVPRLARLAEYRGRLIRLAQWGAAAFFVGCGLTHLGIAIHSVAEPWQGGGLHLFLVHIGPHIAQVLGGATFIAIVARKLDVRFAAKDDVSGERARARLAAIVEDSQDAIIAVDARRRVTGWNPGAERLLGYSGRGDDRPADQRHRARLRGALARGLHRPRAPVRRGRAVRGHARAPRRHDGADRPVRLAHPRRDGNGDRRVGHHARHQRAQAGGGQAGRAPGAARRGAGALPQRVRAGADRRRAHLGAPGDGRPGAPGEPGAARDARPRRRRAPGS